MYTYDGLRMHTYNDRLRSGLAVDGDARRQKGAISGGVGGQLTGCLHGLVVGREKVGFIENTAMRHRWGGGREVTVTSRLHRHKDKERQRKTEENVGRRPVVAPRYESGGERLKHWCARLGTADCLCQKPARPG